MNVRQVLLCLSAFAVLLIPACGEEPPMGGGKQDTTPPAIASVTAIDAYHIEIVFDEAVSKFSAERSWHYGIQQSAQPFHGATATSGEPVYVSSVMLADDEKTVSLNTSSAMADIGYDLNVSDIQDVSGNTIVASTESFVGTSAADVTSPQVVSHSPAPDAIDVPVGAPVVVEFSEDVSIGEKTWISDGEVVQALWWLRGDKLTWSPDHTLEPGSQHTVTLSDIQDISGNEIPDMQWSFTVTTVADNTPPRLISSVPRNVATNVGTQTNISLTFSEPLHPDSRWVTIIPYLDVFVLGVLDESGRTLIVETASLLKDNQQYTVYLEPSYFLDLSGNTLDRVTTITFTTGITLESASIAGRVSGDPGTGAADPSGASVVAEGYSNRVAAQVGQNDTYELKHLPDDLYQIVATKESNGDGVLDFFAGDAIGVYGLDLATNDQDPDSVEISDGAQVNGINFPIYDPSAVSGTLSHSGNYFAYVTLYTTDGFDPQDPAYALLAAQTGAFQDDPWYLNSLMHDFPDGDYYVVAFLDVDDSGFLDPSIDSYNWYGGPGAPIAVHLANGSDVADIVIALSDPGPASTTSTRRGATPRHVTKANATFQHLGDVIRRTQQQANR